MYNITSFSPGEGNRASNFIALLPLLGFTKDYQNPKKKEKSWNLPLVRPTTPTKEGEAKRNS